jgi:predicted dehydrogenase
MSQITVGIAGLGRSGWAIHAAGLSQLPEQYKVAAAMDFDAGRRDEAAAKFGCKTYDNYAALVADPDVELIVVATPNRYHAPNAIEALRAGKHVLCEKPFGTSSCEAGEMIAVAKEAGKIVAPFQNRRYESLFQKVLEVRNSGILGEIQLIRSNWHGFGRRWDWQTLTEFDGGQLLNNGPHAVDQALQMFGEAGYDLLADLRNVLTSGDAEDHFKIVLRAKPDASGRRGPVLDLEMTSCDAYPQDRWLILGDSGSLRAHGNKVEWTWVDWSKHDRKAVERAPVADRSYNRETIHFEKSEWTEPSEQVGLELRFYKDLYRTLRKNQPLVISPESVQSVMRLIEEVKAQVSVQQGRFSSVA